MLKGFKFSMRRRLFDPMEILECEAVGRIRGTSNEVGQYSLRKSYGNDVNSPNYAWGLSRGKARGDETHSSQLQAWG